MGLDDGRSDIGPAAAPYPVPDPAVLDCHRIRLHLTQPFGLATVQK